MTADEAEIDVTEERDINYWAGRLAVSEFELRSTVAEVGTRVGDIADALGRSAR